MRSIGSSTRFVGLLAVLALLSSLAAFATADESDAEPSTFESIASLAP